eukprot:1156632-Pelagomonas_calceolata.AAC.4
MVPGLFHHNRWTSNYLKRPTLEFSLALTNTHTGAVGHGGAYHSQSPESFFCHVPGLKVC